MDIFKVNEEAVTKNMRRQAKAVNFGIVYGMSAWGLSESISISPKDAAAYIKKYFEKHYKIDEFLKNVINEAKNNGYTKTMFNRLRYIPELASMNRNMYSFGERTAMNAPIQGSAADIIKFAMVEIQEKLNELKLKSLMIAQVHDELVFDVCEEEKELMQTLIKETMESVVKLKVDLIAEVAIGDTWLKA
jgi:DNA polymerase-1